MTCVKLIMLFLFFLRRLLLGQPFFLANIHAPCVALPGFRLSPPLLCNALSCAPPVPAALGAAKILPPVIPNSANSHPELDSGSLYYIHPNTESSLLKLTSRRSLSQSKGRAKKMPRHLEFDSAL